MSDLHLEVGKQYQTYHIPVCAPYLILAGDIGKLQDYDYLLDFLEVQCKQFMLVFLVLGNHEYYGLSWSEAQQRAQELCQEPRLLGRLKLLNRTKVELDQVILLGCTLWSHIRPKAEIYVQTRVKDFSRIENWNIKMHNEEHLKDRLWLTEEIQNINKLNSEVISQQGKKRIVVVTHHAPIREGSSFEEHLQNAWTDAFSTELMHNSPEAESRTEASTFRSVNLWIFGHTHFTTECQRGEVRLVSNQRGYVYPWQELQITKDKVDNSGTATMKDKKSSKFDFIVGLFQTWTNSNDVRFGRNVKDSSDLNHETCAYKFDVRKVIEI